jgi:hypothetical protein
MEWGARHDILWFASGFMVYMWICFYLSMYYIVRLLHVPNTNIYTLVVLLRQKISFPPT